MGAGEVRLEGCRISDLAIRIVDKAIQGGAIRMALVSGNVQNQFIADGLVGTPLSWHFGLERNLLILQEEVNAG